MERYETLFTQLKARREGAFVPFVTLGDPNPEQSLKIIDSGRHPARFCRRRHARPVL